MTTEIRNHMKPLMPEVKLQEKFIKTYSWKHKRASSTLGVISDDGGFSLAVLMKDGEWTNEAVRVCNNAICPDLEMDKKQKEQLDTLRGDYLGHKTALVGSRLVAA